MNCYSKLISRGINSFLSPCRLSLTSVPTRSLISNVSSPSSRPSSSNPSSSSSSSAALKKFYNHVSILPLHPRSKSNPSPLLQYGFHFDTTKSLLKTLEKRQFIVPDIALATAIAAEWNVQSKFILKDTMPLTILTSYVIDGIPKQRSHIRSSLLRFIDSDTICYRNEYPHSLNAIQNQYLNPILNHLKLKYRVQLPVQNSISAVSVDSTSKQILKNELNALDDYSLAAMEHCVMISKSIGIGMALRDGIITADEACKCARCEEDFQIKVYGKVEGNGHDIDIADTYKRLSTAQFMFRLVQKSPSLYKPFLVSQ